VKRASAAVGILLLALASCGSPTAKRERSLDNGPAGGATIKAHRVKGGLDFPAAFTFAPKGQIYYGERYSGAIRILNPKTNGTRFFFKIPDVSTNGEQGLLGLALHPEWPEKPFVYAYATRDTSNGTRNQIVRIKKSGRKGSDMHVIFTSNTPAGSNHDGGRILFGPDAMLYVVIGESGVPSNAQDLQETGGKVLRMTPRGKAAPGNPFNNRVFAFGIRNSFGFGFDPQTGRLWESENGPECNDELNLIKKGRNYGWGPTESCPDTNRDGPNPVPPKRLYNPVIAPTGLVFCRHCDLGKAGSGKLFFGAYNTGQIRRVALGPKRRSVVSQSVVFDHDNGILGMERSRKGGLYFSDGGAIYRLVLS
jgi:glucose/arabinose dehydrogenase